jgi:hypothetical protein
MQKCKSYTLQVSKFSKQVNEEQHRLNSDRILYIPSAQTQQDFSDSTKRRWQTEDYLGKWLLGGETKLGKLQKEQWTKIQEQQQKSGGQVLENKCHACEMTGNAD